jgi:hypothetical protein
MTDPRVIETAGGLANRTSAGPNDLPRGRKPRLSPAAELCAEVCPLKAPHVEPACFSRGKATPFPRVIERAGGLAAETAAGRFGQSN